MTTLPRLIRTVAIVDRVGQPLINLQRWWQSVAVAIETALTDLSATQANLAVAVANISTAQSNITAIEGTLTGFVVKDLGPAWTAPTGTASRATFATYAAPVISAAYTQAEVQAIANHVQVLSERIKAIVDDGQANGVLT